ncbi:MAG: hypothetical protein H7301_11370 [Cryobacterium sp.]|nr:hypothetical protein [Oligoflexia bacterium]
MVVCPPKPGPLFKNVLIGLLLIYTCSAHATELPAVIRYEDFKTLVRLKVSELSELRLLWRQSSDTRFREVYLSGGTLRGILHWLRKNLETKSLEDVKHLPVPTIEKLLRIAWSDRDLVAPASLHKAITSAGVVGWDILTQSFQDESTEAGGPGLDKVQVNPWEIKDPLNGLQDYYNGNLRYWPTTGSINGLELEGNSHTALALRYLRELVDLPELVPDEKSMLTIRKIALNEEPPLGSYWINKSLHKLYLATNESLVETVKILRDANLLSFLSERNYRLETVQHHTFSTKREDNAAQSAEELVKLGFNLRELREAERLAGFLNPQGHAAFIFGSLSAVSDAEDFEERTKPALRASEDSWFPLIQAKVSLMVIHQNHDLKKFLTPAQVAFAKSTESNELAGEEFRLRMRRMNEWIRPSGRSAVDIAAIQVSHAREIIPFARTATNFLNVFHQSGSYRTPEERSAFAALLFEYRNDFFNLEPSVAEILEASSYFTDLTEHYEFKRQAVTLLTDIASFGKIMFPSFSSLHKNRTEMLEEFRTFVLGELFGTPQGKALLIGHDPLEIYTLLTSENFSQDPGGRATIAIEIMKQTSSLTARRSFIDRLFAGRSFPPTAWNSVLLAYLKLSSNAEAVKNLPLPWWRSNEMQREVERLTHTLSCFRLLRQFREAAENLGL